MDILVVVSGGYLIFTTKGSNLCEAFEAERPVKIQLQFIDIIYTLKQISKLLYTVDDKSQSEAHVFSEDQGLNLDA